MLWDGVEMNVKKVLPGLLIIFLASACHNNSAGPPPEEPRSVPFTFLTEDFTCNSMGLRNLVINSQAEYDSFAIKSDSACHPSIDFTHFTLLGQNGNAGGCDFPEYLPTVLEDDKNGQVLFKLLIVEHGRCDAGFIGYIWILIPKMPPSYTVVFQEETVIVDVGNSPSGAHDSAGGRR